MSAETGIVRLVETIVNGEKIYFIQSTPQGQQMLGPSLQDLVAGSMEEITYDHLQQRQWVMDYNSLYHDAIPQVVAMEQQMLPEGRVANAAPAPSPQFPTVAERENRTASPTKAVFDFNSGNIDRMDNMETLVFADNVKRNEATSNPTMNPGSGTADICTRKCVVCLEKGKFTKAIFKGSKGKKKPLEPKKLYRDLLAHLDIPLGAGEKPNELGICTNCLTNLRRWHNFSCYVKKCHQEEASGVLTDETGVNINSAPLEEHADRTLEISGGNSANARKKGFECRICHKIVRSRNILKDHLNQHEGIRDHKCGVCGKDFHSKYNLAQHEKTHEARSMFCAICGRGFNFTSYLNEHLTLHTGEKRFGCPICKKMFRVKAYVRTHMKVQHKSLVLQIGRSGRSKTVVLNEKGETCEPVPRRKSTKKAPKKVAQDAGSGTSAQQQTAPNNGSTDRAEMFQTLRVVLNSTQKWPEPDVHVNPPAVRIPIIHIKDEPTE